MKKPIDSKATEAHISTVTRTMTGNDLDDMLAEAGYVGLAGVTKFADIVGVSWRTLFRWRAKGDKALTRWAATSIKRAFETTQAHSSRIRPTARKSKTPNQK